MTTVAGYEADESATAPAGLEIVLAVYVLREKQDICQIQRDRPWLEWQCSPTSDRGYVWLSVRQAGKLEAVRVYRRSERRLPITEMFSGRKALSVGVRQLVAKSDPFRLATVATLTLDRASLDVFRASGSIRRGDQPSGSRLMPGNIRNHDA